MKKKIATMLRTLAERLDPTPKPKIGRPRKKRTPPMPLLEDREGYVNGQGLLVAPGSTARTDEPID